jgi:hypothetical protein
VEVADANKSTPVHMVRIVTHAMDSLAAAERKTAKRTAVGPPSLANVQAGRRLSELLVLLQIAI